MMWHCIKSFCIFSATAIVLLTTGCTQDADLIHKRTYDISEYNFFDTADGLFHFGAEPDLAFVESDGTNDYEYSFTTGEENSLIGIMSVSGLHQTAKGFGTGISEYYQEMYNDATGSTVEYNGIPAYRITYTDSYIYYVSIMLQYGNGDLFVLNITENANKNEMESIAENIIATIEYKGEPLKTEQEQFNCGYFSLNVPAKWCIKEKMEEGIELALNLQDCVSDYGCMYHLVAVPDKDNIRELANERFSSVSESFECTTSKTEFLGNEAYTVTYSKEIMNTEMKWCCCYFKVNGMCYELITSVSADEGKYQAMIDELNESIDFK